MEILAIIPVRGGSKGIPGKNIKLLANRPLLAYTVDAALTSKYITRTIVSTENEDIKKTSESLGVEVLDRPEELALDETKTAPVLLHVVEELEKKEGYEPDVVVLLQATCPLRDSKELDEAVELFLNNQDKGIDSVFAAKSIGTTHSKWRKSPSCESETSYECLFDNRNRPRRQDTDKHYPLFAETGATYIIKTEVMKKVKDFIGEKPELYLGGSCVDIDNPSDFERAEKIIEQRRSEGE